MKRISIITSILFISFTNLFAQNPNYTKTMEVLVAEIQGTIFGKSLQASANKMERIAAAEKTEWLPAYWVAYCYMMDSYAEKDDDKRDLLLDKADTFMESIEKKGVKNDEVEILKAHLANARMAVSPSIRWMTQGGKVSKSIKEAKRLNQENPRIAMLEGQGLYYTPETFGGGKDKAKPVFEKALRQFAKFTPISAIYPTWGESTVKWTLQR